jgi:hypothetical protein
MMLYTAPKVREYREDACEFWLGSFQYVSFTVVKYQDLDLTWMVPWRVVQGGGTLHRSPRRNMGTWPLDCCVV